MSRGMTFDVRPIERSAYRALQQLRSFGENPAPLLEEWGFILEASTRNRFETGRGPGGVPWKPSKRVLGIGTHGPLNGRTLVDKGNLERSVRSEVRGSKLLVGVDGQSQSVKNAAVHQFGTGGAYSSGLVHAHYRIVNSAFGVPLKQPVLVRVRGHIRVIPARPFLGVDANDLRDLTHAAQSYLRELIRR